MYNFVKEALEEVEQAVNKISETVGLAPGQAVPIGIDESAPSKFIVSVIKEGDVQVERLGSLPDDFPMFPEDTTLWIDVEGYAGLTSIKRIFKSLEVHPLLQADILNTKQRTTAEMLDDTLFVNFNRLFYAANNRLRRENVSFLMKKNCIVTFQTSERDSFAGVKKRITTFKGYQTKPSYVFYTLLDNFVDNYYISMEKLGAIVEKTEKHLLVDDNIMDRGELAGLRHDASLAKHVLWPLKNTVAKIVEDRMNFFPPEIDPYFADLRDHVSQLDEACSMIQEDITTIVQLNLDNMSNRTNEIMKTLALISTVFLPLTFIAGVYGMNFKFMPELNSPWGYPFVIALMAMIAFFLYKAFKNKHWM